MNNRTSPSTLTEPPEFLGNGFSFSSVLDRRLGSFELVSGELDVKQAIQIIVLTTPGERVMRPEFGCGIHTLVFDTINTQLLADIKRTITEALTRFEARINVLEVKVSTKDMIHGKLEIDVHYQVRTTNQPHNIVFPFYIPEGR